MHPFLIFGLTANLGSMGELAGHERRGGLLWPARSAVIGLMGAALGIRRDGNFEEVEALEIAVGIYENGIALRDYHTIETVPSAAAKSPNSRPEGLLMARGKTNTTITLRDYRTGPMFGVSVSGEGLETLMAALNNPFFTLYLGRKSCPLSAPPGARIVSAENHEIALSQLILPPWRKALQLQSLIVEDATGEVVHDRSVDRLRWHFSSRRVSSRSTKGTLT